MPLEFSSTHQSQDLQQLLATLIERAKALTIPPIQAVYDPRQLETLFENTQRALDEARSGLTRSKRRQALQLGDFGMSELAIGSPQESGLAQEPSEHQNLITPAIDQTIAQLDEASSGLEVELIHSDPPSLIATCARIKGTMIKCSVNLERQYCAHIGAKPQLTHHMDEDGALAVRHAYAIFRRSMRALNSDEIHRLEEMTPMMERANEALTTLCAEAIFPRMYYRDRLQSLDLRRRIGLWLDEPTDMATAESLRQEIVGMSESFSAINYRQELVEHDERLVQELLGRWSNIEPREPVTAEHYEAIQPLLGCDPLLDGWIFEQPRLSFALLIPALRSLRQ